jgi:hypothetical protein
MYVKVPLPTTILIRTSAEGKYFPSAFPTMLCVSGEEDWKESTDPRLLKSYDDTIRILLIKIVIVHNS